MKSTPSCESLKPTHEALSYNVIVAAWADGLAPPEKLTTSEWSDKYRILPKSTSSRSGRWRTLAFQKEPLDVLNDPKIDTVVLKWGSQLGKSELLNNMLGFHVHHDPAPILFVLPTLEVADDYSENRIRKSFGETPELAAIFGDRRTRQGANNKRLKTFPGGYVAFAGGNSPTSLASRPIRVVIMDEIDKLDKNIGKDGDPILQAFQRTRTFWNKKRVLSSTPSIKGLSHIDDWYQKSDRREFHVPCHACGEHQFLKWVPKASQKEPHVSVRWPKGKPEKAEYICPHCGSFWSQADLRRNVKKGKWIAQNPGGKVAGFHVNAMVSPFVTLAEMAQEWDEAKGDPTKEQAFVNLHLGEAYNPSKSAETSPQELYKRREDFGANNIPERVLLVTAGVDVQYDRVEVQYLGWGAGDESWVLDYVVLPGDPTGDHVWSDLTDALSRGFVHPLGGDLFVEAAAIDSGNWTQKVYAYAKTAQRAFRPFYAIKGVAGQGRPIWLESKARIKDGLRLFIVGVDDAKTEIYTNVAKKDPGPGAIHFASGLKQSYFEQLLSERIIIKYTRGFPVREWHKDAGARNEALDTMVYARAARYSLQVDYEARLVGLKDSEPETSMEDLAELYA